MTFRPISHSPTLRTSLNGLILSLYLSTAGHGATDLCVCQLRLNLSLSLSLHYFPFQVVVTKCPQNRCY